MRILDAKLNVIKMDVLEMMQISQLQLEDMSKVLVQYDEDLVILIKKREKKVDKFDLKINRDCERFLAVCTPVADDLRTIMTINNIIPSIERISDVAEKIAKFSMKYQEPIDSELVRKMELESLMLHLKFMYNSVYDSFSEGSTLKLNDVFVKDKEIDRIYKQAKSIIIESIHNHEYLNEKTINLLLIVSKLERIGDHIKTIAEEIYFCVEGKSLRHKHN